MENHKKYKCEYFHDTEDASSCYMFEKVDCDNCTRYKHININICRHCGVHINWKIANIINECPECGGR